LPSGLSWKKCRTHISVPNWNPTLIWNLVIYYGFHNHYCSKHCVLLQQNLHMKNKGKLWTKKWLMTPLGLECLMNCWKMVPNSIFIYLHTGINHNNYKSLNRKKIIIWSTLQMMCDSEVTCCLKVIFEQFLKKYEETYNHLQSR
jgi:hypothetical protein